MRLTWDQLCEKRATAVAKGQEAVLLSTEDFEWLMDTVVISVALSWADAGRRPVEIVPVSGGVL